MNKLLTKLGNHSIAELPNEACGIITKKFEYIPTKNISPSPTNSFIVDPIAIYKNMNNIWGFFHSHPYKSDPVPSQKDLESAAFKEYKFIVGFADSFYIYWNENDTLKFERVNGSHFRN